MRANSQQHEALGSTSFRNITMWFTKSVLREGGWHYFIWSKQVCAMCRLSGYGFEGPESFKNRVYNFTIKRLEQGVFLDWKPFMECEDLKTCMRGLHLQ